MKSTKTTMAGLLVGLALILHATVVFFDGDPETTFDLAKIAEALGAFGAVMLGIFARDDDVSSEGTRASKNEI